MTKAKAKAPKLSVPLPQLAPSLHARWLYNLLARRLCNDDVRCLLLGDDLPCPTDDALDLMRATHPVPKGFSAARAEHAPSATYLRELGLEPFFRHTAEANEALALLRNARAREVVEAASITGVPLTALIPVLAREFGASFTLAGVELYGRTFFDVAALGRAQLRVAVHARVKQAVFRQAEVGDERAAHRAVQRDARVVAVALPRTNLSWSAVLLAMGLAPMKRSLGKAIDEIEQLAVARMHQVLARAGDDDERRALSYATIIRTTREIREKLAEPNEATRGALQQLRIIQSTSATPTVRELVEAGDEVASLDVGPGAPAERVESQDESDEG